MGGKAWFRLGCGKDPEGVVSLYLTVAGLGAAVVLLAIGCWNAGYKSRVKYEVRECIVNNYCLRKVDPITRNVLPD